MSHPSHVTYTDFRAKLAQYMDEVCDSRASLHVTRQRSRSVVMIAEDEYESMMEMLHLLDNPVNATRLIRSVTDANEGKLIEREIS